MKIKPMVLSAILGVTLVGQALASENGIVYKQASEDNSYCHIKYMAFKSETLRNPQPEFNPADIIDRYSSCDFNPSSKEQVQNQLQVARDREDSPSVGGQGGSDSE